MGKIVNISSKRKLLPINIGAEDTNAILTLFFGINFNIFSITDDNDLSIGYSAVICQLGDIGDRPIDDAAIIWNRSFRGKVFRETIDIVTTFMDCVIEQRELISLERA